MIIDMNRYNSATREYVSAFGVFVVPDDVFKRAVRLKVRFGRDYLDEWCQRQWAECER